MSTRKGRLAAAILASGAALILAAACTPARFAPVAGAKWLKDDGTSAIGGDPAWREVMQWQKELVDWYGYKNLEKFRASLGDEFSADHAFHKGQVAR